MTDSQNRREALLSRAATTQAGEEEHPAYDEKSDTFNVPADLMRRVWNTIDLYANPMNYRGERTGGILQGCPRAPDPTPEQMSVSAYGTLQELIRWRWPKEEAPPSRPVAPAQPQQQPSAPEGFDCAKCGQPPEAHWDTKGECPAQEPTAADYRRACDEVLSWYPESAFPEDGESLDCKSAKLVRLTIKNVRELAAQRAREK